MKMNYFLFKSLEHRTLVTIAESLWNQQCSLISFPVESCLDLNGNWVTLVNDVKSKVELLLLPANLREKLLAVIHGCSRQAYRWIKEQHYGLSFPMKFFWFTNGILDREKIMEDLIKSERDEFDAITRFKLASLHCLGNEIPNLWEKLPDMYKYNIGRIAEKEHEELLIFWANNAIVETYETHGIPRDFFFHIISNHSAFERALFGNNFVATKFFWHMINPAERERILEKIMSDVYLKYQWHQVKPPVEILNFLLSHMNEQQQVNFIKQNCFMMLSKFSEWPWGDVYETVVQQALQIFDSSVYLQLLRFIVYKLAHVGEQKCVNLFKMLWPNSQPEVKKAVLILLFRYMFELLLIDDIEFIDMILPYVLPNAQEKLVVENLGYSLHQLLFFQNWDRFHVFAYKCQLRRNSTRILDKVSTFVRLNRQEMFNAKFITDIIESILHRM